MTRLTAVAFALVVASSAQAMPPAPLHRSDEVVITVREGCGPGMVRGPGGVCVARAERPAVRRCLRWEGGACARWGN
jgi:hypothetical protein